jgi:hypothetical protein
MIAEILPIEKALIEKILKVVSNDANTAAPPEIQRGIN